MASETSVFEATYRQYRDQLSRSYFGPLAVRLGVQVEGNEVRVPLLGAHYRVSPDGVFDPYGDVPVCVVLLNYRLRCPDTAPAARDWVSYRGLKDSGPLTVYFANEVEGAIAAAFSGRADALAAAGGVLGGRAPDIGARYDLALQFSALPRVPLCLLFNDADDEFPAACSLLFERRSEVYLDPECLAMLGRHLFVRLKRAAAG